MINLWNISKKALMNVNSFEISIRYNNYCHSIGIYVSVVKQINLELKILSITLFPLALHIFLSSFYSLSIKLKQ